MTEANPSYYNMLRGMIALAWVDNALEAEERQQLLNWLEKNKKISDAQQAALSADINTPHDLDGIWEHITEKQHRAHLINIAVRLFHADGDYSAHEQDAYARINALHHATLDVDAMQAELSAMASQAYAKEKELREEELSNMSRYERVIAYIDDLID